MKPNETVSGNENSDSDGDVSSAEEIKFPCLVTDPAIKRRLISSGPTQPHGPFPKDEQKKRRSFSENYYSVITKLGLLIVRNWLYYSIEKDFVYCLPCWIFPAKGTSGNPWGSCGVRDWKHLSERIKSHETSESHVES